MKPNRTLGEDSNHQSMYAVTYCHHIRYEFFACDAYDAARRFRVAHVKDFGFAPVFEPDVKYLGKAIKP